jgi:uncharacterized protein YdeI (BOF family)
MKRIMPALLLAAAAVPASAAERRFTLTDFDRIQVEGPYEVVLVTGKAPSALASGSAAAVEGVSMDVQGRVLKIRPNRSTWGGYPGERTAAPRLTVTAHGLRGASVTGSGRLTVDKAKAMRFDAAVSGSGQIVLGKIEADNLVLGLLGSGGIEIGGEVKSLRAMIQGSGDLNGQQLTAQDAVINADTSGRIDLSVRGTAKVRATGPGETLVKGGAACTVEALGSGPVLCGD